MADSRWSRSTVAAIGDGPEHAHPGKAPVGALKLSSTTSG
jgi:hypothetical protein